MSEPVYEEISRNPLSKVVRLDEGELRLGREQMPLAEVNLVAMADAYLNQHWLGGGGAYRPLNSLGDGKGIVPVIRSTGSAVPVRARRASEFARRLGELAVRHSGGASVVAEHAAQSQREGVPLWFARRVAQAPSGPITVMVDRQLARVHVSSPVAPPVRLGGEFGPRDCRLRIRPRSQRRTAAAPGLAPQF